MQAEYLVVITDKNGRHLASGHSDLKWLMEWVNAGNDIGPDTMRVDIVKIVATRRRPETQVLPFQEWERF